MLDLPAGSFILTPSTTIKAAELERWLVDGIIPAGAVGELVGGPGTGKTFLALRLMAEVASQGKSALLLTRELGLLNWNRRTSALAKALEMPDVEIERLGLFTVDGFETATGMPLRASVDGDAWRTLVDKVHEDYLHKATLGLVVIDTFANFFSGEDENAAKPTIDFYAAVRLLSSRMKCSVLVIHHASKGNAEEARGSNAHLSEVDFALSLSLYPAKGKKAISLIDRGCILQSLKFKESEAGKKWQVNFDTCAFMLRQEDGEMKSIADSSLVANYLPLQES